MTMSTRANPRVLTNTIDAAGAEGPGAVWKLAEAERDLDANLIVLPAGERIDAHDGPELDVLVHVVAGSGSLETEADRIELSPGTLAWLPRRSRRAFAAGSDGLCYLTVHRRRQALTLAPTRGNEA
jgi:quercetin dioxygenase-like cupin family protein